jgi:hypothetical protein
MHQSPWEAAGCSDCQEIAWILWILKILLQFVWQTKCTCTEVAVFLGRWGGHQAFCWFQQNFWMLLITENTMVMPHLKTSMLQFTQVTRGVQLWKAQEYKTIHSILINKIVVQSITVHKISCIHMHFWKWFIFNSGLTEFTRGYSWVGNVEQADQHVFLWYILQIAGGFSHICSGHIAANSSPVYVHDLRIFLRFFLRRLKCIWIRALRFCELKRGYY